MGRAVRGVCAVSATGRGAERRAFDSYFTPAWCVHRLLEALPLAGGRWLEPCVGDGSIVRAVSSFRGDGAGQQGPVGNVVRWTLRDIRTELELLDEMELHTLCTLAGANVENVELGVNAVVPRPLRSPETHRPTFDATFDVAITNPPYVESLRITNNLLYEARVVVMLLRLNFLAGEARADWMRAHTPDVYVLPNRPSFTEDGKTDATEYAWFVWGNRHRTLHDQRPPLVRILESTPKEQRR